jgi:hypothetical protein
MSVAEEAVVDLGSLAFPEGGYLLVRRALAPLEPGERLLICGESVDLRVHVRVWCRAHGHGWQEGGGDTGDGGVGVIVKGTASRDRWQGAERAGESLLASASSVHEHPPGYWGLAARGACVEAGLPDFQFGLDDKIVCWTDEAPRLYAQAAAAQWDPATAIPWDEPFTLPDEVEDAVVQIMTYLIENETVAMLVPARFLSQMHPHFREIMQLLAIQAADEARHIEVFTRRAQLKREVLGYSTVGGQLSLKTLLDEPDFALATFLLSVLGEGTFLSLLWFLHRHAPDPVTRTMTLLAAQDEARHVAFGMAHLARHASLDDSMHARLAAAVQQRHDVLLETAGLNEEVFDALVLLAAGSWERDAVANGYRDVMELQEEMDTMRQRRLIKIGFSEEDARSLSALHTRNFM